MLVSREPHEVDGNRPKHDLFFVVHVHRHAQARRFMRHDVVAPELFAQGEAGGDVVGMVSRNGVNRVKPSFQGVRGTSM